MSAVWVFRELFLQRSCSVLRGVEGPPAAEAHLPVQLLQKDAGSGGVNPSERGGSRHCVQKPSPNLHCSAGVDVPKQSTASTEGLV